MAFFITAIKFAFVPDSPGSWTGKQSFCNSHFTTLSSRSLLRLCLIILLLIFPFAWKEPSQSAEGPWMATPREDPLRTPSSHALLYGKPAGLDKARTHAKSRACLSTHLSLNSLRRVRVGGGRLMRGWEIISASSGDQ